MLKENPEFESEEKEIYLNNYFEIRNIFQTLNTEVGKYSLSFITETILGIIYNF